jgi:hypothetical protein
MEDRPNRVPAAWASWASGLLGVWLVLAPFVLGRPYALGYVDYPEAVWTDIILGVLIVATSYTAVCSVSQKPSWWTGFCGLLLILAPFGLNYQTPVRALTNDLLVGFAVVILATVAALAKSPNPRSRAPG